MNNALNAKLSKLIYTLASDDPEYLSKQVHSTVCCCWFANFIGCWTKQKV